VSGPIETHLGADPGHGGLTTHRGHALRCPAPDCASRTSDLRELVRTTVEDLALNLLVYDRKEDEELPPELIHELFTREVVTPEELVVWFSQGLRARLVELGLVTVVEDPA
jgi:hypothetical protein